MKRLALVVLTVLFLCHSAYASPALPDHVSMLFDGVLQWNDPGGDFLEATVHGTIDFELEFQIDVETHDYMDWVRYSFDFSSYDGLFYGFGILDNEIGVEMSSGDWTIGTDWDIYGGHVFLYGKEFDSFWGGNSSYEWDLITNENFIPDIFTFSEKNDFTTGDEFQAILSLRPVSTSVPEPATVLLLGAGAVWLLKKRYS